jgi:pilus assembly protein FimV
VCRRTVLSWHIAYPTLVAVLVAGWVSSPAWALTLGRLSAQSAVGQPLVAQLEVIQISTEQAASLEVSLAEADRFAAANMTLSPVLNGLRVRFAPSEAPGRASIKLETTLPVNEPFLDIALHFRWSGGELLRTYTVLLDPPNLETALQATPLAPDLNTSFALPITAISSTQVTATEPLPATPQTTAVVMTSPPAAELSPQVSVRVGDTANRIAQNYIRPDVTIDQFLVALLRANPHAFINGNVNLLKAGASLVIPTTEQSLEHTAAQARLEVRAQTKDFIEYRQRLAHGASAALPERPAQRVEGRVEDKVEVITPRAEQQDRLELSKDQSLTNTLSEEIAQKRQEHSNQQRLQELESNLENINALAHAAKEVETTVGEDSRTAPPSVDQKEEQLSLTSTLSDLPQRDHDETAADRARHAAQQVIEHPATLPSAFALVVILASLGTMRVRRLRQSQTFKKTADRAAAHAAKVTPTDLPGSISRQNHLSTPNIQEPVDPLAEAEVYMAYGMADEAESMLRHTIDRDPNNLLAHLRLLDIYTSRKDISAFNTLAQDVFDMTLGQTPEWDAVASIGRRLDPSNPLYHPMVMSATHANLDLPDEVKGLSLDLGSPSNGNQRPS